MSIHKQAYEQIIADLRLRHVTLVAVSKTKSVAEIKQLYDLGQRDFGENYVQELIEKQSQLPTDIRWHFIGHLQTNKVKLIASFINLIQSVDSSKLLQEINKQAQKNNRAIDCLLQIHIAQEETKFGLDDYELNEIVESLKNSHLSNVHVKGLMGMASLTDNVNKIRTEFKHLKTVLDRLKPRNPQLAILSMGMSSDYSVAIEEGSNLVRIGRLIFGERI